ncbi:MAG: biotin--[acetyl-CoA-carboxylase] ligase [Verrucomicrobiota bacterium]
MMKEVIWKPSTESTNDDAKLLGEQGVANYTTVVADSQSKGRGQRGRDWQSPAGKDLLFSVVYYPRDDKNLHWLPLAVGASVHEALLDQFSMREEVASVKWPNDIYIGDRKLSGILVEMTHSPRKFCILGIGINVNSDQQSSTLFIAVSLKEALGDELDRVEVLNRILSQLEKRLDTWLSEPFRIRNYINEFNYLKGREVEFRLPQSTLIQTGSVLEVAENAALVIETNSEIIALSSAAQLIKFT